MAAKIDELLSRVRAAAGDTTDVEVKSAAAGLPQNLTSSLCALANLPGGGWLILGLSEEAGFAPVGLSDPQALKQGLIGKARSCVPPVQLEIDQEEVDGSTLIVARVLECSPSAKPCRVGKSGPAWIRAWDGDFTMSALEEQAFLALREQPHFDRANVAGASRLDLDGDLVALWARTATELDPGGLGRFSGEEQLFRAGVIDESGTPTKAGLLALGVQPQQFFPRYVVNLAVDTGRTEPRGELGSGAQRVVRAREVVTVSGPIPLMLEACLDWARKVFARDVVADSEGAVRDRWQYPMEAFRELVGNALVHRDLDSWSEGEAVEVRLLPDRLVVSSPGGLYGITIDRLGHEGRTSARNARLVEVCRYTRASDGTRVVETLASGIPRILEAVRADGLPKPIFNDTGVNFTAILRSGEPRQPNGQPALANASRQSIWQALTAGAMNAQMLTAVTGLKIPALRKQLRAMVDSGVIVREGGQGRPTTYRRP